MVSRVNVMASKQYMDVILAGVIPSPPTLSYASRHARKLRLMGSPSYFSAIFTKGSNFCLLSRAMKVVYGLCSAVGRRGVQRDVFRCIRTMFRYRTNCVQVYTKFVHLKDGLVQLYTNYVQMHKNCFQTNTKRVETYDGLCSDVL